MYLAYSVGVLKYQERTGLSETESEFFFMAWGQQLRAQLRYY